MKYKNRAAAPAHLQTKTELQQQRLKLAPGQPAAGHYWQGHSYVPLYDPAGALPMRPRREPTRAQLAALASGRHGTVPSLRHARRHYLAGSPGLLHPLRPASRA